MTKPIKQLCDQKGDATDLVQAHQGDASDGSILDLDDLKNVSGGGMFNEIVKSSSPFRPQSSDDQKKPFGV